MPYNWFRPKPGAFGGQPIHLELDPVGRSGRTLTTAGSTTFVIPTPYRKFYVRAASVHCTSLVGTSGSTTVKVQKVVSGTGTPVALTNAKPLEGLTAKVVSSIAMASAATDANRQVNEGDILQAQFINVTGIDVQPVDLYVLVEGLQLE
jgi:hypothetical protein